MEFKGLKALCETPVSDLIEEKTYVYQNNGADVLFVAHLDTVFDKHPSAHFYLENDNFIFSPMLDDRAGLYTILYHLPTYYPKIKFDYLLTTDEEIGMSTAKDFNRDMLNGKIPYKEYNWCAGFDRAGSGCVLYDYKEQKEWKDSVEKCFKTSFGSFSDISYLTDLGCCALNVGIGYESAHQLNCYTVKRTYVKQMARFENFYNHYKNRLFEYDAFTHAKPNVYKYDRNNLWNYADEVYEEKTGKESIKNYNTEKYLDTTENNKYGPKFYDYDLGKYVTYNEY